MMNLYEPLFLLLVLVAVVTILTAAVQAVFGRFARAGRILLRLAIGAAVYMSVVIVASLFGTRRVYSVGEEQCRDDWCITVTGLRRPAGGESAGGVELILRLRNRARRVPMGENGTVLYLIDGGGRRFDPLPNAADVPFTFVLQPGESVETSRHFRVPGDARDLGAVYRGEGGFPISWFIISEPGWFLKPPIVRLQ